MTPVIPTDTTAPTTTTPENTVVLDDEFGGRPNLIDEPLEQTNETENEPIVIELIEYVTIRKPAPTEPLPEPEA